MHGTSPLAIVNYRSCNCASIQNIIYRLGREAIIADDADDLRDVWGLILPGVGSFDAGVDNLERYGFSKCLLELVLGEKMPILGICLGMQLMAQSSEEGVKPGLGWVNGRLKKFQTADLPVPHMGWNVVHPTKKTALFELDEESRFYFVHSYYLELDNPADAMTLTPYGLDFVSSFNTDNIFGVQFHPEKSHRYGMKMIGRFLEIVA